MLVSNCCRCGEKIKKKKDFKACANFGGQTKATCPCLANGYFSKAIKNIVPRKRFREYLHHHKKDSTEDYLRRPGMEVVQGKWSDFENVFLFVVVSFLREIPTIDITLESIYKFFNVVEKHLVVVEKYKIRKKSVGQISSKIAYCRKLI